MEKIDEQLSFGRGVLQRMELEILISAHV